MAVALKAFVTGKAGCLRSEFDDAWAPARRSILQFPARLAVADGATESIYAGLWARILTRAYCASDDDFDALSPIILRAQRIWRRATGSRTLPWYAQMKMLAGSGATLLGLQITMSPTDGGEKRDCKGYWNCVAVGDTCLFHVRGAQIIRSFPLSRPVDFDSAPDLVSSKTFPYKPQMSKVASGEWQEGDRFFLATDAMAAWLMTQNDAMAGLVERIASLTNDESFGQLVDLARFVLIDKPMRDDDVTLVIAEPHPDVAIYNGYTPPPVAF